MGRVRPEGRPGRGSPDGWTQFGALSQKASRTGEQRHRTRTKARRRGGLGTRPAAGGPDSDAELRGRSHRPAEGRGLARSAPHRLPFCGAAAISRGGEGEGEGRARARAERAGASPLFSACGSPARTSQASRGCVLRSAAGQGQAHERPSPSPPFGSGRSPRALAPGARGKRLTRGSLELRRGKLCVEPRGAAARALEGAPGPWALGRRSPSSVALKKKEKKVLSL